MESDDLTTSHGSYGIDDLLSGSYNNLNDILEKKTQYLNRSIVDPSKLSPSSAPTPTNSIANSALSSAVTTPARNEKRVKFGLAWVNLTFSPQLFMSRKTKTILRNISGQIKFGTITGLMGPSGCGKSTLLRCINGRIESGLSSETEIYVSTTRAIDSCFIVQDQKEHLLMGLTTKESLLYASKIKNHGFNEDEDNESNTDRSHISTDSLYRNNSGFDHNRNVNKLISDLTLTDCTDTLILNCSGGEQKRIVIALELIGYNKPNIMCIDEPTSGLDSNAAEQVIDCLCNVSRDHSIGIVTAIHQPNTDVLMMFDSLYVLSKGGYCVYNGKPEEVREFLLNSKIFITERQVPIEILLKVASKTKNSSEIEDNNKFDVDEEIKELSKYTLLGTKAIKHQCMTYGKLTNVRQINVRSVGFNYLDFWYLMLRTTKCTLIRGWKSIVFIFLFELLLGISTAMLFGETGRDDGCLPFNPNTPQNITYINVNPVDNIKKEQLTAQNVKFLFFSVVLHNFLQLCYTVLTFPSEVKIFFNEQQNHWYSTGSYYWAKNLVDSIVGIVITVVFTYSTCAITHQVVMNNWYNGLIGIDKRLGIYLLSNILCTLNTQGMAYTFSILATRSLKVGLCLAIGGILIHTLFSGFFIPISELNDFLQAFSYTSYYKIAFETQISAVYGLDRCDSNQNQWSGVLYQLKIKENIGWNLKMLVLQLFIWRLIALIWLIIKTNDLKPGLDLFKRRNSIKSYSNNDVNNGQHLKANGVEVD